MQSSSNYFVKHETCPKCRSIGNDKSGDNLGVWSDGSTYCFNCGYTSGRKKITQTNSPTQSQIVLPSDVVTQLPYEARQWLNKYELTRLDISRNHIMWSEKYSRIVFPYFNETELLAWQGRYIGEDKTKAKWFSQGKIHEIIHPLQVKNRFAVIVEDIVSAIKVSKICGAIPIFGSSISTKQWLRLKTIVDRSCLWLDPDLRGKSLTIARVGTLLGVPTHPIFSDKDPKEHTIDFIADTLRTYQATT